VWTEQVPIAGIPGGGFPGAYGGVGVPGGRPLNTGTVYGSGDAGPFVNDFADNAALDMTIGFLPDFLSALEGLASQVQFMNRGPCGEGKTWTGKTCDVPVGPIAQQVLPKVNQQTQQLNNPCTIIGFYGAAAGVAGGTMAIADAPVAAAQAETLAGQVGAAVSAYGWSGRALGGAVGGGVVEKGLASLYSANLAKLVVTISRKVAQAAGLVQDACTWIGQGNW